MACQRINLYHAIFFKRNLCTILLLTTTVYNRFIRTNGGLGCHARRCDHDKACDDIVNTLRKHCGDYKVLGFDCEWVSVGRSRKAVALLQLASTKGFCGLFHLCHMHHIPKSLKNLLEDKGIIKVGVDRAADAQKLQEDSGIYVASTFNIRYLAVMIGCNPVGLEKLSRLVLNVDVIKPRHISASNWEDKKLNDAQIEYAMLMMLLQE
uniref:3'-5' exonuclease domain-containing protein n=1 Tax=Glossina morsitans morsitans TaxID=37546 RepID=A0A1B0GEB3_GLOMM